MFWGESLIFVVPGNSLFFHSHCLNRSIYVRLKGILNIFGTTVHYLCHWNRKILFEPLCLEDDMPVVLLPTVVISRTIWQILRAILPVWSFLAQRLKLQCLTSASGSHGLQRWCTSQWKRRRNLLKRFDWNMIQARLL